MIKDTSEIKNKIVNFLENNGPSLPVHIAKNSGMDMLFTSAFLSELLSQHRVKTSKMKVGTSPIYFLSGQEPKLEKFSEYLKGKEKEAYLLLKEKKFLIEEEQETAIKVALTNIPDFAFPFEKENKIIWRYLTNQESEYLQKKELLLKEEIKNEEKLNEEDQTKEQDLEIEAIKKSQKKISEKKKTPPKKKSSEKKNEKFFNTVKEYLKEKQIEITDIISFSSKDLILKITLENKEKLFIAFNKKRITETDILWAYKKSQEQKLDYTILSFGEPAKKTTNLIEAAKKLDSLVKIEQS